jgi:hypothetical protein
LSNADKLRWGGNAIAALWILGGALYFFVHFTSVFYQANKSAIDGVLDRIRQLVGG